MTRFLMIYNAKTGEHFSTVEFPQVSISPNGLARVTGFYGLQEGVAPQKEQVTLDLSLANYLLEMHERDD